MQLTRLDDYQSWMVEVGGRKLVIDPWLTDALGGSDFVLGRKRDVVPTPKEAIADASALIITAQYSDHLDPPTLAVLRRDISVFAQSFAAKKLEKLGFTNVTVLRNGNIFQPFEGLEIEGVQPGFPYRHNSIGVLFRGSGETMYFETHSVDVKRHGHRVKGVDVAVIPMQGVWLAGVPFVMTASRALEVAKELLPKRIIPTGVDPQRTEGLLTRTLLRSRGAIADFAALLAQSGVNTTFVTPAPGESVSCS